MSIKPFKRPNVKYKIDWMATICAINNNGSHWVLRKPLFIFIIDLLFAFVLCSTWSNKPQHCLTTLWIWNQQFYIIIRPKKYGFYSEFRCNQLILHQCFPSLCSFCPFVWQFVFEVRLVKIWNVRASNTRVNITSVIYFTKRWAFVIWWRHSKILRDSRFEHIAAQRWKRRS